jgi:hypothetical protein
MTYKCNLNYIYLNYIWRRSYEYGLLLFSLIIKFV